MGAALQTTPQGRHQPGVLVGDDQAHALQPSFAQAGQKAPPEHLVLGITDIEAEDFA